MQTETGCSVLVFEGAIAYSFACFIFNALSHILSLVLAFPVLGNFFH
jgi:hypothetical protein